MRKDWETAKGAAKLAFKNATGSQMVAALSRNEAPPSWPFKFDKDLGPTLDKYEAAKKSKKEAEASKRASEAKKVVVLYRNAVKKEATELDKLDKRICLLLLNQLKKIEDTVGA